MDILKEFLESFHGVEAMYSVNVTATFDSNTTDNRKITGIGEFKKNESPVVSCLFISPSEKAMNVDSQKPIERKR